MEERVAARIERHDAVARIVVGSEILPFGLFEEFRASLISNGVTEICRLYDPPDYSRIPRGGYLWDAYSPESVQRNLVSLFTNLLPAYSTIVEHNFPQLMEKIPLFRGATRVIVVFEAKDQVGSIPSITFYYLRSKNENTPQIQLLKAGQDRDLETKLSTAYHDHHIELDGKSYECNAQSSRIMRFKYDELPMLDFIYEELQAAFRNYFAEGLKRWPYNS